MFSLRLGRLLRVLIDLALRELRKRLVGLLLLTKRGLEKLNRLVEAELLQPKS